MYPFHHHKRRIWKCRPARKCIQYRRTLLNECLRKCKCWVHSSLLLCAQRLYNCHTCSSSTLYSYTSSLRMFSSGLCSHWGNWSHLSSKHACTHPYGSLCSPPCKSKQILSLSRRYLSLLLDNHSTDELLKVHTFRPHTVYIHPQH